jgi:uncharacterized membrane protein YgdD (TMEM256/DUF423 family)
MQRHWIFAGAILAALAVGLGAFGAHGLDGFLLEKHGDDLELVTKRIGDWKTAALYQMHHAIGMILIGVVLLHRKSQWLNVSGWCFLVGIAFFSGLLYVLVLTEIRILGAIVPIGGVSFIAGWVALAMGGCCMPAEQPLTQLNDS